MNKYIFSLALTVSLGLIPSISLAQEAGDCTCVTPIGANANAAGSITSVGSNVLVDGLSADTNSIINVGSQVLVGDGGAAISIGQSCQLSIPGNSEVTISQPDGPGSNLCIKRLDTGVAQGSEIAGAGHLLGAAFIFGGLAAVVIVTNDDDDNKAVAVKKPASH